MKFGLWDHVDRSDLALSDLFDKRLEFLRAADTLGYYSFHVSEHHATPLNMTPVPGVFLGAVAQATKNIRLGPLTYLLPLYSPLRLIEEICMLDHLSHGRLDVGVSRGVNPFEMRHHNFDMETSIEVFNETLEIMRAGLGAERLSHEGKHFKYEDVPIELQPLQKPHPPIWYPSSGDFGSRLAGRAGYHFVTLGGTPHAAKMIAAYKEAYSERGGPDVPCDDFEGGTAIGALRSIVIADSEQEALDIARPAYERWYANLTKLRRAVSARPTFDAAIPETVDVAIKGGAWVAGTAEQVREQLEEQAEALGGNYMILAFYMGTIAHEHAMRSMTVFAEEVMPKLAKP